MDEATASLHGPAVVVQQYSAWIGLGICPVPGFQRPQKVESLCARRQRVNGLADGDADPVFLLPDEFCFVHLIVFRGEKIKPVGNQLARRNLQLYSILRAVSHNTGDGAGPVAENDRGAEECPAAAGMAPLLVMRQRRFRRFFSHSRRLQGTRTYRTLLSKAFPRF